MQHPGLAILILLFLLKPLSLRLKWNLDKFSVYLMENNAPLEKINSITRNPCKNTCLFLMLNLLFPQYTSAKSVLSIK